MECFKVNNEKPNTVNFEYIDVWVYCCSRTYSALFVKNKDKKEGNFYLSLNFLKKYLNIKTKKEMKELLNEIDDLLARLEDFTHGEDGEEITKIRGKILLELSKKNI